MQTIEELHNLPPNEWVEGVRSFHKEKLPYSHLPKSPTLASVEDRLVEVGSLTQEFSELVQNMALGNLEEIIDGAVDSIYVLIGILLKHGVDPTPYFADVQRSNMDKDPAAPGTLGRKTADGKSMKPDGWIKPRIKELIEHQVMVAYAEKA